MRRLPAHMPALDGVRGIAILAVLLCHSWGESVLHYGSLGVDLFFVLSGFLITGILVDTLDRPAYLQNFYVRRALRLFPLAFAYLAVCAFVLPLIHRAAGTNMVDYQGPWWWYVTYLQNWKAGHGASDSYLGHFWSLAVEEQFYLAWPFVVLAARRRLWLVCIFVVCGSLAFRVAALAGGADWQYLYRNTICRIDTIAMGALVALAVRSGRSVPGWLLCLAPLAVLPFPWDRTIGQTAVGLAFSTVVWYGATSGAHTWMEFVPLRSLGKYSYCLYVIHVAVIQHVGWVAAYGVKRGLPAWITVVSPVVALIICYVVAVLSYMWFESPLLKLKERWAAKRPMEPRVAAESTSGRPFAARDSRSSKVRAGSGPH